MAAPIHDLSGEIALITGGTGAIGKTFARTLLDAGAKVVVIGRGKTAPVDDAVREIAQDSRRASEVHGYECDAMDEAAFAAVVDAIEAEIGYPSILVNTAGGNQGKGPFVEIDTATFDAVLRSNILGGLIIPSKIVAAGWIERQIRGVMVNIASMASYKPLTGVWAYSASKSAILNLTSGMAREFAQYGIRVNAIAPGFFVGFQNQALLYDDYEIGLLSERGKAIIERTPFGRFGRLDELAGTLLYLCDSNSSGFVTGACVPVDGGYLTNNI